MFRYLVFYFVACFSAPFRPKLIPKLCPYSKRRFSSCRIWNCPFHFDDNDRYIREGLCSHNSTK